MRKGLRRRSTLSGGTIPPPRPTSRSSTPGSSGRAASRTSSRCRSSAPTTTTTSPSRRSRSSSGCSSGEWTSRRWDSNPRTPTRCCSSVPWTCSLASSGLSTADETGLPLRPSRRSSVRYAPATGGPTGTACSRRTPPVRELTDEIWVVQINPKELQNEPSTVLEIVDRRNELSGNLSLYQELRSIEKVDQLLEEGLLSPGGKYKQIVVRVIELARSRFSRSLGTVPKLNRDPRFIEDLMFHGEARAEEFLAALAFEDAWRGKDPEAVADFFAEDAELVLSAPFPGRGAYKGRARIRSFVTEYLAEELRDRKSTRLNS